jgi:hypothetical protein
MRHTVLAESVFAKLCPPEVAAVARSIRLARRNGGMHCGQAPRDPERPPYGRVPANGDTAWGETPFQNGFRSVSL